jgi:hypothetical protein
MGRYEDGLKLKENDKNCCILVIHVTRAAIFRDHGAVRYNMDFIKKAEIEKWIVCLGMSGIFP